VKIKGIRFEKGIRFHPASCRGGGHRSPHHLLDNPGTASEMCAEARSAAQLAIAAALTGLATAGLVAHEAPEAPEGEDRLLDVKEAAKRLSVSTGWLYRNAGTLPFTKRLGPWQLRFSEAGLLAYIRAKSAA
jgi:predicted DNA-binding transcriptional regulator AlpA